MSPPKRRLDGGVHIGAARRIGRVGFPISVVLLGVALVVWGITALA